MSGGLDLSGQLIVLSGGAGALGIEIGQRLAGLGAQVVAVDLRQPDTPSLPGAGGLGAGYGHGGGRIDWRRADVADQAEVDRVLDQINQETGRFPDTVCCHAGVTVARPILDYPVEAFDELFRVNVRGAFVLAQASARRWRQSGVSGHLLFTGSWVQDYPWPEIAPYCASKAALYSLMRGFAKELAPYGIRANAILPGIVAAGMARRQWEEDPGYRTLAGATIALGELQEPSSVADAFAFLCSPLAAYMTGSALRVDGGCSLGADPGRLAVELVPSAKEDADGVE